MLVHVKRDELLAIAAQTAKAAPKTATSEAVLGIHVEADSRRSMLTLTATNYEIVIRASMGASVEQSGSVVISAALFPAAIPRRKPNGESSQHGPAAKASGDTSDLRPLLAGAGLDAERGLPLAGAKSSPEGTRNPHRHDGNGRMRTGDPTVPEIRQTQKGGGIMPTCQKKDQLCRCIDWPDEDFDVEIDHFIRNFEFLHVELEYASLDAREPVRVCRIGRCRVCGGRMCDGTTLPPEKTVRELMPTICLLAGLAFQQFGYPLPAGTSSFREVFPTLFHEEDQAFAKQWLSEPEGWHLMARARRKRRTFSMSWPGDPPLSLSASISPRGA